MTRHALLLLICIKIVFTTALDLEYLNPVKLQTKTSEVIQARTARQIIEKYSRDVKVHVDHELFVESKDIFILKTFKGQLEITASSGVAAVWGFNYFLKKYCNSHIGWQVKRVVLPDPLPEVDEQIIANDRFRFYQDTNAAAYSYVWWDTNQWREHVQWMALNGINLALAPVAQEAAWANIYRRLGMTQDEIDQHFTGPAYLPWLRYGNIHGWGGPLPESWHARQRQIQRDIVDYMFNLGIVPVFPAFNGHVPKSFSRIFPKSNFHTLGPWLDFNAPEVCCNLFVDPRDPLFEKLGAMFLKEIFTQSTTELRSHIYIADPFIQINLHQTDELVTEIAKAIFSTISKEDSKAVWLIQNLMFINNWPDHKVKSYLTSVPNGRILILEIYSENKPQYDKFKMYYGQPFIWNMRHTGAGNYGMYGALSKVTDVYKTRSRLNSTMIGMGIAPSEINQNYVVYDFTLESAWRDGPVTDLDNWVSAYAERRYGCNATADAWRYLLKSVYSARGTQRAPPQSLIFYRPSFLRNDKPWAWYKKDDLFTAFRKFVFVTDETCFSHGFYHDLVDVTRQALQYRAEQLYIHMLQVRQNSHSSAFAAAIRQFIEILYDMEKLLRTNTDFSIISWLTQANNISEDPEEAYLYDFNARSQVTSWVSYSGSVWPDYAGKPWAELFLHYYIPRWEKFLYSALDAMERKEEFNHQVMQEILTYTVEREFLSVKILKSNDDDDYSIEYYDNENNNGAPDKEKPIKIARSLFKKWAYLQPSISDLEILDL